MQRRTLWIILSIIIIILAGVYLYASYFFSDILIASKASTLAEDQAKRDGKTYVDYRLPTPQDVAIEAGDVTLSGWLFENEREGDCGVLMLHGRTATRFELLPYAPLFWERGCDLLAYDARGHGDSSAAYHTYGYHEKEDGKAVFDWFMQAAELQPDQIGLVGVSYGAATVLQMIPVVEDAAFVLADSPYQDLYSIVAYEADAQYGAIVKPFLNSAFLISELRADFEVDDVSAIKGVTAAEMPVFLTHSLQDEFTPATNSEVIYAHSNPAITTLFLTDWDAPHVAAIRVDYDAYKQNVDQFLTTYVPDFGIASE